MKLSFASWKKDESTLITAASFNTYLSKEATTANGSLINETHTTSGMASWLSIDNNQVLF